MTGKSVISASVDEENEEWLESQTDNKSAYINNLLTHARQNGGVEGAVLNYQIAQLEADIAGTESTLETKRERLESLKEQKEMDETVSEDTRKEWLNSVRKVPKDTDHPLVQDAAEELDMTPEEVLTEAYDQ